MHPCKATLQTAEVGPLGIIHSVQSLLKAESGCVETRG